MGAAQYRANQKRYLFLNERNELVHSFSLDSAGLAWKLKNCGGKIVHGRKGSLTEIADVATLPLSEVGSTFLSKKYKAKLTVVDLTVG